MKMNSCIIHIPFELKTVKCPNKDCEMEFAVVAFLGGEMEYWVFQDVKICPYCGEKI